MFMHRIVVISDEDIVVRRDERPRFARRRKVAQRGRHPKNGWGNMKSIALFRKLCEHPEPCKPGRSCGCYNAGTYCDRNCGCPSDCEPSSPPMYQLVNPLEGSNRRVGCRCHAVKDESANTCDDECPCIDSGRECDPELCNSCDARSVIWQ